MDIQVNFVTYDAERTISVEDDILVHSMVKKSILKREKGLFQSKWFDYRFMTPLEATSVYIDDFAEISRWIYAREFDRTRAEHIKFRDSKAVLQTVRNNPDRDRKAEFSGFWVGRQIADMIGMPYPTFIELAMTYRMRAWKQSFLPRSHQLYDQITIEKVVARWQELQESQLWLSKHPAYLTGSYQDLPVQRAYHDFLVAQARSHGDTFYHLLDHIAEDMITLEQVRSRLTDEANISLDQYL